MTDEDRAFLAALYRHHPESPGNPDRASRSVVPLDFQPRTPHNDVMANKGNAHTPATATPAEIAGTAKEVRGILEYAERDLEAALANLRRIKSRLAPANHTDANPLAYALARGGKIKELREVAFDATWAIGNMADELKRNDR